MKRKWVVGLIAAVTLILGFTAAKALIHTKVEIKTDQYVTFGKYYDQPILWHVITTDAQGAPMLITEHIISLKAFDANGDKNADSMRVRYGSNYWPESNIRLWLNSSDQKVKWLNNPPTKENLCGGYNPYADESGFLSGKNFSGPDRNAIKPVTRRMVLTEVDRDKSTSGSEVHKYDRNIDSLYNYDKSYAMMVEDKVFFLNLQELKTYFLDRGWSYRATPTGTATFYSAYEIPEKRMDKFWEYWLMDAVGDISCAPRNVLGDLDIEHSFAYMVGGVRPALYLDPSKIKITRGTGTLEDPLVLQGKSILDF